MPVLKDDDDEKSVRRHRDPSLQTQLMSSGASFVSVTGADH
jgi:hypothetical protein